MIKKILLLGILIIIIICIGVFIMMKVNKKKIDSIKEFEYTISDGRRGNTTYEIKCDDKCILTTKLIGFDDDKKVSVELDNKTIDQIVEILKYYDVASWDGFNKSDKRVLDGTSYDFKVITKDNVKIYASGYMKYPKNYKDVVNKLTKIFDEKNDQVITNLFDDYYYKDFNIDNVIKVEVIKYTEGGNEKEEITDKEEIIRIYNNWSNTRLISECMRSCEDNTTVYKFIMSNGGEYSIEKECDWLVINNKRYYFE